MRIFLGLMELCGYFSNLKKGFESLGHTCDLFNTKATPIKWGYDDHIAKNPLVQKIYDCNDIGAKMKLLRDLFDCVKDQYDVFILAYGSKFTSDFSCIEELKSMGKKVIYTFFGSDSRPFYMHGDFYVQAGNHVCDRVIRSKDPQRCYDRLEQTTYMLKRVEELADIIISHPPSSQLHKRPFVPWLHLGMPFDPPKGMLVRKNDTDVVRVLHAPSHPLCKGTPTINSIVSDMIRRGIRMEYIQVNNEPNIEVLNLVSQCDFIIDEMFSDNVAGGMLSIEAGYFGKPSVSSGYVGHHDLGVPQSMIPPTYFSSPQDLYKNIHNLYKDSRLRDAMGRLMKKYVHRNYSPKAVAKKYLDLIKGVPDDLLVDPNDITYIHGYGISEALLIRNLRVLLDHCGEGVFGLEDKPVLKQKLLEMIQ